MVVQKPDVLFVLQMQIMPRQDYSVQPVNKLGGMIAPLSGQSVGLQKAVVTNGIREVWIFFL